MPVLQVGVLLSQGQMTEELATDQSVDHASKFNETDHSYYLSAAIETPNLNGFLKVEMDEYVLSRQADDIQTPPPNLKG